MPEILFLCTGNYYRSRFAEAVFNHGAQQARLPWRAFSRGLAIHLGPPGGTLSPVAAEGLRRRNVPLACTAPRPVQVSEVDLRRAARIVALKEAEHRPLLAAAFPGWEERVDYWHVSDLDQTPGDEAMDVIASRVHTLLDRLAAERAPGQNLRV